jgi:glucose/arabinose dehydrogenase
MKPKLSYVVSTTLAVGMLLGLPAASKAQTVSNPSTAPDCMNNTAFFNPTLPPSINLPPGFTASVFASGLNAPTGIAFLGNASSFQVYVLESGHGSGIRARFTERL